MRRLPLLTLVLVAYCIVLAVAAFFCALAQDRMWVAQDPVPSTSSVQRIAHIVKTSKQPPAVKARLNQKLATAKRNSTLSARHLRGTLHHLRDAISFFLIPLVLAGLPFAVGLATLQAGTRGPAIALFFVSLLALVVCYLGFSLAVTGGSDPPPPPGPWEQDMIVVLVLYAGNALMALLTAPLYIGLRHRAEPETIQTP